MSSSEDPFFDEENWLEVPHGGLEIFNEECVTIKLPLNSEVDTSLEHFKLESVHVAFTDGRLVRSSYSWKRWMHKAILYFTRSYTHSELAFRFISLDRTKEVWVACSIYAGECLQFEFATPKYATEQWSTFEISMTPKQQYQLLKECIDDVSRPTRFNEWVYVNFFLPHGFKRDCKQRKVWCSEHISSKFKSIGLDNFESVEPYTMDPLELFDVVKSAIDTITVHPMVLDQAIEEGLQSPYD